MGVNLSFTGAGLTGTDSIECTAGKWVSYPVHATLGTDVVINLQWNAGVNVVISAILFDSTPGPDITAPATVTNPAAGTPTTSSLTLTWTASADDGSTGIPASSYDIRYRTGGPVDASNWASATPVANPPTPPAAPGSLETKVVSPLNAGTTYYFGIKTADEVPNWSGIATASGSTSSAGGITFSNNTLTYSSTSDLSSTIDPSGQKDVTNSYGVTKASFQALNPQIVAFNGAPAASQTLRTLVANYDASHTVTFTFPLDMYNYGSVTTKGRGSFSGSNARHAISTVPVQNGSLYDWFDATITSTGGRGRAVAGLLRGLPQRPGRRGRPGALYPVRCLDRYGHPAGPGRRGQSRVRLHRLHRPHRQDHHPRPGQPHQRGRRRLCIHR